MPRRMGLNKVAAVLVTVVIVAAVGAALAYYGGFSPVYTSSSTSSFTEASSPVSATQQETTSDNTQTSTATVSANNSRTGEFAPAVAVTSIEVHVLVKIVVFGIGFDRSMDEQVGGFSVPPGSLESFSYVIKNTQNIVGNVQITSVRAATPNFTIVSVSPPIPIKVTVSPGFQLAVTLGIRVPSTSYAGPLEVDVDATYG
jgi:hypothetical protein